MNPPRSVLITGASSGIGEALAVAYAGTGIALALSGRNRGRLEAVAETCRQMGAEVVTSTISVTNRPAMAAWIGAVDDKHPLDLVVANAGISEPQRDIEDFDDKCRLLFDTNLTGVLNTVNPALERMVVRNSGQIAIMSSLSAYRGLAGAPAYSASKAAVKAYGEGLRGWAGRRGVAVSVICPGFVVSRLTAKNRFPMPKLMDAERAARIIRRNLGRRKGRISFPFPMYSAAWLLSALPDRVAHRLTNRLPDK
jgi:NADP-dependent 3-hydroxy acid dehydrogenase YdfG